MPKKYDECVKKVKASGSAVNAYAVCKAGMKKKKKKKKKKKTKK